MKQSPDTAADVDLNLQIQNGVNEDCMYEACRFTVTLLYLLRLFFSYVSEHVQVPVKIPEGTTGDAICPYTDRMILWQPDAQNKFENSQS